MIVTDEVLAVAAACAPESDHREVLTGVHIVCTPHSVTAEATDGKFGLRAVFSREPQEGDAEEGDIDVVVPGRLMDSAAKMDPGSIDLRAWLCRPQGREADVQMFSVSSVLSGNCIQGEAVAGKYPDMSALFKTGREGEVLIPVNVAGMMHAMRVLKKTGVRDVVMAVVPGKQVAYLQTVGDQDVLALLMLPKMPENFTDRRGAAAAVWPSEQSFDLGVMVVRDGQQDIADQAVATENGFFEPDMFDGTEGDEDGDADEESLNPQSAQMDAEEEGFSESVAEAVEEFNALDCGATAEVVGQGKGDAAGGDAGAHGEVVQLVLHEGGVDSPEVRQGLGFAYLLGWDDALGRPEALYGGHTDRLSDREAQAYRCGVIDAEMVPRGERGLPAWLRGETSAAAWTAGMDDWDRGQKKLPKCPYKKDEATLTECWQAGWRTVEAEYQAGRAARRAAVGSLPVVPAVSRFHMKYYPEADPDVNVWRAGWLDEGFEILKRKTAKIKGGAAMEENEPGKEFRDAFECGVKAWGVSSTEKCPYFLPMFVNFWERGVAAAQRAYERGRADRAAGVKGASPFADEAELGLVYDFGFQAEGKG